jgi:uncharacterized membrane-anchored protein
MTLRELLSVFAPSKLARTEQLAAALHDGEGNEAPLLVRLFSAIGTWIGAAMIATIFAALEIHRVVPVAVVLALALFVGAVWLSRRPARSLAMTQLIWTMTLGAHGLIWGAMVELGVGEATIALTWTLLAIVTSLAVVVPSLVIASAMCAVLFATWGVEELDWPMGPLWVALPAAAVATAAWVAESRSVALLGRRWSGLAYGLPIGVAGSLSVLGFDDGGMAARYLPGMGLALLWLVLAHLRKSAGLQTIASIQLGAFLFFFYYELETTLLLKSLWVASTGAVLLLGAYLVRRRAKPVAGKPKFEPRPRMVPAVLLVALTVGLVVVPIVNQERILANGRTVLLPLAPVDPRSLIQGDYMQLRYELEVELERSFEAPFFELHQRGDVPRHGELVLRVDDEGVGHFVRIDDGTPLGEHELLLEYRLREDWGQNLRVGAESFLFEEGTASLYEGARFGELVVSDEGEAILVGLRDADKQPLGPSMHRSRLE